MKKRDIIAQRSNVLDPRLTVPLKANVALIKPALLAPPKEPAKPLRPSLSPSIIMNIFQPGDRNFP